MNARQQLVDRLNSAAQNISDTALESVAVQIEALSTKRL
jgi:hypothetical protein